MHAFTKKRALIVAMAVIAVMAAGLIAGCGGSSPAPAKTKGKVVLLSWGGSIEKSFFQMGMAEKFKQQTGYELELIPKSDSAAIIQQALAQKDNPQVDVVMCDAGSLLNGTVAGIWTPLPSEKIPNMEKLLPISKHTDQLYVFFALTGIVYDKDAFAQKQWKTPTSLEDMFNDQFKGKIAYDHFPSSYAEACLLTWAEQGGGGYDNVKPGFEKLAKLAPNIYEFSPNMSTVENWLIRGDIHAAIYSNVILKDIKNAGKNVAFVIPSEGAYVEPTAAAIMKNGPNPEGAAALMNFLVSEEFLQLRYNEFSSIPSNKNVKLDPEGGITWETLAKAKTFDYEKVRKYRPAWVDQYNAEIVPIAKKF
ncbi:MAG: extracellular solute-binding protein [Negativicutes bacterium]|nr:extracellular solute-binding protein [Negativicutes bacterium]